METINATAFRQNLYKSLVKVGEGEPLRITSKIGDCILISAHDWEALKETLYLMGNADDWKAITAPVDLSKCVEELDW